MIKRKLVNSYLPHKEQGFLGQGHIARPLISGDFKHSDPFIYLMDDNINKIDQIPVGGPHPHAGFETVSLLVDGKLVEQTESMEKGDFQIMTAGSGTIHTEIMDKPTKGRLFQLWLTLPKENRWTTPRLQILNADQVPVSEKDGIGIRLYSGSLAGISSPVLNYVPLIVAEITLNAGKSTTLDLPANFNAFIVVISGTVKIGEEKQVLVAEQVGWLNHSDEDLASELQLNAGTEEVRLILYAGKPQGDAIVSQGPFIADNADQIQKLYQDFRHGKMNHIATAPQQQIITY
jgi:redox-sensitive bicupin YhaK (pirin superfamily)